MVRHWQAPPLDRALGQTAHDAVAKHFGRDTLVRGLAEVLA
jgi:hypothetical protein